MFSSPWDAMLIRAETAGQSLRIHGAVKGGGSETKRQKEERRERDGVKKRERVLRRKGKDVGPLKEDAARCSQLSHLVVNP